MIKVAMIARSTLFSAKGGDTIQALQTASGLSDYGFAIDIKLTNETIDYSKYNLLHFFNITRPADILYHIRKANIPFVVSPIMINYSEYDKYYRSGLAGFLFRWLPANGIEYIKAVSRWLLGKDKMMSLSYLWKGQKTSVLEIMKKARLLLPNSSSEYKRIKETYGCNTNYLVVPNAVDSGLFKFDTRIKKTGNLVICAARIEGIKNQLNLIKALNNTKYQLLIIGAPAPNQLSYYQNCKKHAAGNIRFIEQTSQKELAAYYQQAKVHVLASWFETTGLSSLEAAAMGCNIVITDKGDTKEYFGDDAFYCTPSSPESIYSAIEKAAASPLNEKLQTKISAMYTWQQASMRTAEGYKQIIY